MIKKSFNNEKPTLFIISTPIGNLGDITKRAMDTIESVDILLCEDTRTTGSLISKLGLKKPILKRYDVVKENHMTDMVISLLENGNNVGLVSDAGTPIISDPGFPLVKRLRDEEGINVVTIPGATAAVAALSVSGLNSRFYFHGFLPPKSGKRIKELEELKTIKASLVFYVSPYKLVKVINAMQEVYGDCHIHVAKEITKLHETNYFGKISEVLEDLPESIKGEYVVVVDNS